ncbi:PREDICTED: pentatricopeptide repeat-containing protein At5g16860-like [Fragaria vesca subsp. vesca]
MEQSGVKANDVTLLCVLFACSHRGMVEEGLHHFSSMEQSDLVPRMEHYACIVDLLGRVGRLNDAMDFIKRMPVEPNEMVWQALLLATCRVHENVELGEISAEKIFSIRPKHSATYVLLSNTWTGSYEDGLSLRDVMKDQGLKKEPGSSWISKCGYASDIEINEYVISGLSNIGQFAVLVMDESLLPGSTAVAQVHQDLRSIDELKSGIVAYKLKLPSSSKIHDVFHVSLLKKKLGANVIVEAQLSPITDAGNTKLEPEAMLQTRIVKKRGAAAIQWLIKWIGCSTDDAT